MRSGMVCFCISLNVAHYEAGLKNNGNCTLYKFFQNYVFYRHIWTKLNFSNGYYASLSKNHTRSHVVKTLYFHLDDLWIFRAPNAAILFLIVVALVVKMIFIAKLDFSVKSSFPPNSPEEHVHALFFVQ